MLNIYLREGRSSRVLTIVLFFLSGLLVALFTTWASRGKTTGALNGDYATTYEFLSDTSSSRFSDLKIKQWHYVEDLDVELAQFESVFWEPQDTDSLRRWLKQRKWPENGRVLEIGTGTGLVSFAALLGGAASVVATDINPSAFANAAYNAEHLGLKAKLETRLVSPDAPGPFEVLESDEMFDLIVSNPPWEDAPVKEVAAFALYDPQFTLLDGILSEAAHHLQDGGKLLLAYGAKTAIERILATAPAKGWQVSIADDRALSDLPEVFVPGILLILERSR